MVVSSSVFADYCFTIATSHKNPRVKQLVLELTLCGFIKRLETDAVNMVFKATNAKLVQIILKDTSNSVRDAAVNLLVQFKIRLSSETQFP